MLDEPKSAEGKLPATARQARLAELLRRSGFLSVAETAERLGVSSMTIRRDLESLEARGILTRTHGGAIDNSGNASTPDIFYGVPLKTKSFYDVYRNDDPDHPGTASGGLCTLGAGSPSGGAGAIGGACGALALIAIALARRGRKGPRA